MRCLKFKPLARGAMLGFADLQLDNGLVILGCSLLEANGKRWVNPPGRPQLDAQRKLMYDGGKVLYAPVIEFADKSVREAWSKAAVAAIAVCESTTPAGAGAGNGAGHHGGEPRGRDES